jgi:capsular polysaccharide biosynthesis protein
VPSESRKELLAIGAILMLALAIGIGHLVDGFDRRLWDVREIEHVYGRPVLIEVGAKR